MSHPGGKTGATQSGCGSGSGNQWEDDMMGMDEWADGWIDF
jgi:hypothetical protein